jgi:hypothetical protein
MRTFLARCTMLGLLVGGFALTGDAGWIISKGQSLLDATTVPSVADGWSDQPAAPPPDPETAADLPPPIEPAARPPAAYGPVDVQVTPSLAAPTELPPAGGGEAVVDLRLLRPGRRVRLWTGGKIAVFDIVDPATGEAIQQPVTRRVRISGTLDPHRIERGGMIVVQPRAGISGHQPTAETLGPVQAIGI